MAAALTQPLYPQMCPRVSLRCAVQCKLIQLSKVQKNTVQHSAKEYSTECSGTQHSSEEYSATRHSGKKSAIRAVIRSQLWKIFGLLDYMWKIFVYYIKSGDLFTCDNKEEFAV